MSAFLDTNVLIRHLTGDPADVAVRATAYLRTAPELFLTDLVVAETIYVLESYFEAARLQIAESIRALLAMESIVCVDTSLLHRAIEVYETARIDFQNVCFHFVAASACPSGMMVGWQTSNAGAPPATPSSRPCPSDSPAGQRWASAKG